MKISKLLPITLALILGMSCASAAPQPTAQADYELTLAPFFNVTHAGTNLESAVSYDDTYTTATIDSDLTGSYILNKTVKNGELSSVSPIMAAYPVVDILLGIFLLGEHASPLRLILVFVIAISIIVLASDTEKTDYAPHPKLGILFAVIYMLLTAFST